MVMQVTDTRLQWLYQATQELPTYENPNENDAVYYDFGFLQPRTPEQVQQAIRILTTHMAGEALRTVTRLHEYGRIMTVAYTYWEKPDPILPISMISFGQKYEGYFRDLAYTLRDWRKTINQTKWYQQAMGFVDSMYEIVSGTGWLTPNEDQYFRGVLHYTVTNPQLNMEGRSVGNGMDMVIPRHMSQPEFNSRGMSRVSGGRQATYRRSRRNY